MKETIYKYHHRHTWNTIKYVVKFYLKNKKYSYRDVSILLKDKGIDISHKTILFWVKRYSNEVKLPNRQVRDLIKK